jgi:hypothetical protein
MKHIGLIFALLLLWAPVQAKHDSHHPLTADDWKEVMSKVLLLENSGLLPTLLPVIMRNRDTLALTEEQVSAFRAWRKENYTNMVNIMNEIIEKMVQFRIKSLSPDFSNEHLLSFQSEIHDLQRQLLKLKLSCRELVVTTFTDEQWENFAFVVSDDPKLASLMSQANSISADHKH